MRLEEIQQTASAVGRLRLVFDDGTKLMVYPSVIAELCLYPGLELDAEAYSKLLDQVGLASAKNRAVHIVAASGVSERALRRRLIEKGENAENADAAVSWLHALSLLDDRKLALQLVQSGIRKGYGEQRLRQILYEKQIPREYWDEALSQLPDDPSEQIESFLERRLAGKDPDEKLIKRTVDALMRRGFRYEEIKRVLRAYLEHSME